MTCCRAARLWGDPAQLGGARAYRFDRHIGRAENARRACRHHRQGHAAGAADRADGLQPLPEFKPFEQPVIAHDKVRYVGEPMAMVIADSVAIGEDALEAIEVEIESLPTRRRLACARRPTRACCSKGGHQPLADLPRRARRRRRGVRQGAYTRRETSHRPPLRPHHGAARRHGGMGRGEGRLTVSGAAKSRSSTAASWPSRSACRKTSIEMIENDVGGGFGARGEFYRKIS